MADDTERHSRWALQVGNVVGIPIRVHFTFLLLLVWFGSRSALAGQDIVLAVLFLVAVFGCVLLHELGHSLMALRFGVKTHDIVLYPIGGIARLENMPRGKAELWIAAAGPAVNVVLMFAGMTLLAAAPLSFQLTEHMNSAEEVVSRLVLANGMLFAFNLIPAFPMDGGRMLRAGLAMMIPVEQATRIATTVGQAIAILFGIASFTLLRSPVLMMIAVFVFIGASREAFLVRRSSAVVGRTARDAMIVRFETLTPQSSLDQAAAKLIDTHQQDFPVVDVWERVVGVLSRARLLDGLTHSGGGTAVLEVMEREVTAIQPETDLGAVVQFFRVRPTHPLIVMDDGHLVGMITHRHLTEFIEVSRRTVSTRQGTEPPTLSA
jgi:Zn-dependent protease/predicted transcriptional regulator